MPFLHDDLFVDMPAVKWQSHWQSRLGQKTFTWPAAALSVEDGLCILHGQRHGDMDMKSYLCVRKQKPKL